jgi:flagellar motor protein MotB
MSDSWLDKLPGSAKQKKRAKYKMSAHAYEKLRQKVVGPEKARQEMEWNEAMAQLQFGLETEPQMKEAFKEQIEKDIAEQGIEAVLELSEIPADLKAQIESGGFDVSIINDQIVLNPEGNIGEKIPMKRSLTESYLSQLQGGK